MVNHLNIGGEKRAIRFSINALLEFQELTGLDITDLEGRMKMLQIKNLRALAFVGFKHGYKKESGKEPTFTIEDVGDWLDIESQNAIMQAFSGDSSGDASAEEIEESKKKLVGENSGQ